MTTLSGTRSLWIHQYDQLAEPSIAAICQTATQYARAAVLLKKVFDGSTIMGPGIDHAPLALDSIATFRAQAAEAAAAGVALLPWVNATHHEQAALHATCGNTLVVDLEPYAQFWQDGPSAVPAYLAGLRAGGCSEIIVCIDPRTWAETALGVPDWAGSVDALALQVYWTDFQQPAASVLPMLQAATHFGVPVVPVLPQDGTAADMAAVWSAAQEAGCTGVSLWRMGTAGPAALRAFGALPLAVLPPTDPRDLQIQQLQAQVAALTTARDQAYARITNGLALLPGLQAALQGVAG